MKIRNKIIALVISLIAIPTFAFAQKSKIYVGAEYTKNTVDTGIGNVSSKLDESDNGYSIFLGTEINPNLDIELSYNDFGNASFSGVEGNRFNYKGTLYEFTTAATLKAEATSWGVGLKPKYQINPNFNIGATLGMHRWDGKLSGSAASGTLATASKNDTDFFYGIGVNYIDPKFSVGLNYNIYQVDGGSSVPIDDIKSIGLRVAVNF
jgi:hypothetical protein